MSYFGMIAKSRRQLVVLPVFNLQYRFFNTGMASVCKSHKGNQTKKAEKKQQPIQRSNKETGSPSKLKPSLQPAASALPKTDADASIESLKRRIATDSERLEKTLEFLQNPKSVTSKKPKLADFKWPLFNNFLLASIVYYVLQYSWGHLDYEEKEREYKQQVDQLETKVRLLQAEVEHQHTKNQASQESSKFGSWRRVFWL